MENRIEQLEQVMRAEVELGEALVDVMTQKQRAVITFQSDELTATVRREEELLQPFRELERERMRIASALVGLDPRAEAVRSVAVRDLLQCLDAPDAVRISTLAARLKAVVERIVRVNDQNRLLLQRSYRFVQETLRRVTDDRTRTLVDHKL
jgi:flagellar biosynthesis/type III secretory pathway chaperone